MKNLYKTGDLIANRYEIIKIIGRGSIGITYMAEDLQLQQKVAIKVVFLTDVKDWKILELFEREAKVLANLDHPAIPQYIDYFEEKINNQSYFCLVQELIDGESLSTLVENGRKFTEAEIKNIAIQCLEILEYLHNLTPPVIHRDIKPQNIILTSDSQVYLVDFGTVQDIYRNTVSIGGTFVGTFGYMPPEQFRGQTYLNSDLYSLGASLIYLITRKSPADLPQKNLKIDFHSYAFISSDFTNWIDKMIEPMTEDRFPKATKALEILKRDINSLPISLSKRINVIIKSHNLLITIKPIGWNNTTITSLVKCTIWNYFLVISPWLNIFNYFTKYGQLNINVIQLVFLLLSSLFGISLFINFLTELLGVNQVEINQNKFKITWKSPTMKQKRIGETEDITRLEIISQQKDKYSNSYCLILWHGIKEYTVVKHLTREEALSLLNYFDEFFIDNNLEVVTRK